MRQNRQAWLAVGVMVFTFVAAGGAMGATGVSTATDPGFIPDTGQINRGFDPKPPTEGQYRKIPTRAEALAAKMTPVSAQPALGSDGNSQQPGPTPGAVGDMPNPEQKAANATASPDEAQGQGTATTGSANSGSTPAAAGSSGPIGAIGATMPAKFSQRNDTLDRIPTMARPLPLSAQDRKKIYQAVMADKTPVAIGADDLAPASVLSSDQYFRDVHPLPESIGSIGVLKSLLYVKAKNKVLLVEPQTRIVFDEIDS